MNVCLQLGHIIQQKAEFASLNTLYCSSQEEYNRVSVLMGVWQLEYSFHFLLSSVKKLQGPFTDIKVYALSTFQHKYSVTIERLQNIFSVSAAACIDLHPCMHVGV